MSRHATCMHAICGVFAVVGIVVWSPERGAAQPPLRRSGENDVDFIGNLEAEEGELLDDLAGAAGKPNVPLMSFP